MNSILTDNPSIDILNELKLAGNHQITSYNENQFNEISKVNLNHIENLQYLKPFISNSSNESQYDVAALVHLLSLQRNKMRVLAFLNVRRCCPDLTRIILCSKKRCDQLKKYRWNHGKELNSEITSRISPKEREFFDEYCNLIEEYNRSLNIKLNVLDSDICSQSIDSIYQNNSNLCQIVKSRTISKKYLEFSNDGKLETKSQDVFYNSGSLTFFTRDQLSSLKQKGDIIPIQKTKS
ncbi:DNA replication complex GINS protein PSF1 [Cryptosporidium felis]|nr:DNA replication complex GINS protein PSF1 [Cryptosporidium felis]